MGQSVRRRSPKFRNGNTLNFFGLNLKGGNFLLWINIWKKKDTQFTDATNQLGGIDVNADLSEKSKVTNDEELKKQEKVEFNI